MCVPMSLDTVFSPCPTASLNHRPFAVISLAFTDLMNREVEKSSVIVVFVLLIEFFQLLSFPFYDKQVQAFPWNSLASWIGPYSGYVRICTLRR